jgi:hypothetical protein
LAVRNGWPFFVSIQLSEIGGAHVAFFCIV